MHATPFDILSQIHILLTNVIDYAMSFINTVPHELGYMLREIEWR